MPNKRPPITALGLDFSLLPIKALKPENGKWLAMQFDRITPSLSSNLRKTISIEISLKKGQSSKVIFYFLFF